MNEEITLEVQGIINTLKGNYYYAINYDKVRDSGSYLWVYRESDQKMVMIIHGGEHEPFEIKLITIDEGETINKHFDTKEEMIRYIKKDLLNDMMVYEI